MNRSTVLWQYNKTTGYWKHVRLCDADTAQQWLALFQRDEPDEVFKLARIKPTSIITFVG